MLPPKYKLPKKLPDFIPTLLFMLFDYLGIVFSEYAAFFLRNAMDFWNQVYYAYSDAYIFGWIPLLFLIFLRHSRSYRQMKPVVETMRDIFLSVFYGWMASIILIYFLRASDQASRLFIILFGVLVLLNVCIIRYAILKILKRRNIFSEPIIIVGAGLTAELVIKFWREDLGYRYNIIGLIDDHPVSKRLPEEFPIIGGFSDVKKIVRKFKVKTVIIAAPGISKFQLQDIIKAIQPRVQNISFIPDLIGTPMSSVDASILFSEKILMLNLRNNLSSASARHYRYVASFRKERYNLS